MPSALIHRVRVWFWCFNVNIHVGKNDSALKMTFVIVCINLYVYWLIVSLHMYFPLSLKICTSQIPHIILPLLLFDCWISMVIQPRCFWVIFPLQLETQQVKTFMSPLFLKSPQIISVLQNSNEKIFWSLPEDICMQEIKTLIEKIELHIYRGFLSGYWVFIWHHSSLFWLTFFK